MVATDTAGLLRGVLENPADLGLRLVYADAVQEGGDEELAELIRLEIDLDRRGRKNRQPMKDVGLTRKADWDRHWQLKQHEWAVYSRVRAAVGHGPKIADLEYDGWVGADSIRYATRGGLVAEVDADTDTFLAHAATLFNVFPITAVHLADREPMESVFENQPASCKWIWVWNERALDDPSSLPGALFRPLWVASQRGGPDWAGYPTAAEAKLALSCACVTHGRSLAGLSPLFPPETPTHEQDG